MADSSTGRRRREDDWDDADQSNQGTVFQSQQPAPNEAMSWNDILSNRMSPGSSEQNPFTPTAAQASPQANAPAARSNAQRPALQSQLQTQTSPYSTMQDDEGPDTLFLRHHHLIYEMHFRPYAISDGVLLVGDVRQRAARKLSMDPANLILLYKGIPLWENNTPVKAYNLKQYSEITCSIYGFLN